MTPRLRPESQRAYVERVLRTEGRIAAWDCLYEGRYEDGGPWSITRLATVIWALRHEAGWAIDEEAEPGKLAVYIVRRVGPGSPADVRTPAIPTWAQGWLCTACGRPPASAPEERLGGFALAICDGCHERCTFRRAA